MYLIIYTYKAGIGYSYSSKLTNEMMCDSSFGHIDIIRPKIVMGDIVSFERLDGRGEWVRVE